ncbi:MAG: RNA-binding protein [Pseudomonadota bacterium]
MTRGGKRERPAVPERRCVATGESQPRAGLIRFVLAPDGATVVPDLAGRLPGRGAWLTADRAAADKAEKKRLFSRAFRRQVSAPDGLADLLESLLVQRLSDTLALARKAGQAVTGFEKVRARLRDGGTAVLITASDAAEDGAQKLRKLAGNRPCMAVLTGSELGLAFGREFAIHAALDAGGLADRALEEAGRLAGFRDGGGTTAAGGAVKTTGRQAAMDGEPRVDDVPRGSPDRPTVETTTKTGGIRPSKDDG